MMRKNILFVLTAIFLMAFSCLAARAQELSDPAEETGRGQVAPETLGIDPDELLQNGDQEYFLRDGLKRTFSQTQGYLNEILDGDFIHQYYVRQRKASDLLMSMLPAEEDTMSTNLRLDFKEGRAVSFHASLSLQRAENIPAGQGGRCWVRVSNTATKMNGSEEGVILFPGYAAYYFAPAGIGEVNYEQIMDLSILNPNREIDFDIIRLDGVIYFYANDEFLFAYRDGINGKLSVDAGSELFVGGNRIRCDFGPFYEVIR